MKIGNLYEIYSNNKDSFCVGKITYCDDMYVVFEDVDLSQSEKSPVSKRQRRRWVTSKT